MLLSRLRAEMHQGCSNNMHGVLADRLRATSMIIVVMDDDVRDCSRQTSYHGAQSARFQSSSKRHKTPITQQLEVGSLQRPVVAHASILAIIDYVMEQRSEWVKIWSAHMIEERSD